MADNSGICYTWSGDKKIYESGELSISPDKVKFVDFDYLDNQYAVPVISNIFTSSNNPPGISLEEGTAMYTVGLRDSDIDINNNNYLTYTPPDGYELVSEDNKNDPGVEEYYMSKKFYCDPITVYYGTAAKSFTYLTGGKTFYYKEIPAPPPDTHHEFYVYVDVSSASPGSPGTISCSCSGVDWIPGTDNGNVTLGIGVHVYYGLESSDDDEDFYFSWLMKDGIDTSEPFRHIWRYNMGMGFTSPETLIVDNGDGSKTYYDFHIAQ